MRIEVIKDCEKFQEIKQEWNILLQKSNSDSIYLTWEWLYTWWEIWGKNGLSLSIIIVRKKNELIGIAPLFLRKTRWKKLFIIRKLNFLGKSELEVGSNYMDFIIMKGREKEVLLNLAVFLLESKEIRWNEILLSSVYEKSNLLLYFLPNFKQRKGLEINQININQCPYIELPKDWESYLKTLGSNTRRNLRSDRRKLFSSGRLEYIVYKQKDAGFYLDDFIAVHRKRWESRLSEDAFLNERSIQFIKKITQLFSELNYLRINFLKHNDKIIAGSYNFIFNGRLYAYQTGVDIDNNKKVSMGLTEFGFSIEDSIRNGYKEFDFFRLDRDGYKLRLAKGTRMVLDVKISKNSLAKSLFFK